MAKRTDQEIDDELKTIFGHKRWSPMLAQMILAQNGDYDPPDEEDVLESVGRLLTDTEIQLVQEGDTEIQSVYVTTTPRPAEIE
jgi:hypothetical protein